MFPGAHGVELDWNLRLLDYKQNVESGPAWRLTLQKNKLVTVNFRQRTNVFGADCHHAADGGDFRHQQETELSPVQQFLARYRLARHGRARTFAITGTCDSRICVLGCLAVLMHIQALLWGGLLRICMSLRRIHELAFTMGT